MCRVWTLGLPHSKVRNKLWGKLEVLPKTQDRLKLETRKQIIDIRKSTIANRSLREILGRSVLEKCHQFLC